jgi:hypothetical protein
MTLTRTLIRIKLLTLLSLNSYSIYTIGKVMTIVASSLLVSHSQLALILKLTPQWLFNKIFLNF